MYVDSNVSSQNRLVWLEILEMLWSMMRLIFKTSSVTPDFFYVFNLILSFSTCSESFEKICAWEILGANVLKARDVSHKTLNQTIFKSDRAGSFGTVSGSKLWMFETQRGNLVWF